MKEYYAKQIDCTVESLIHNARMARIEAQMEILDDLERVVRTYVNVHGKLEYNDLIRLLDAYNEELFGKMEDEGDRYDKATRRQDNE